MNHQALYRKYRPQKFSEVIGQKHVVQTLTNAISMEMISHAYLFAGPRGSGKTTIARIFAKAINCLNRKKGEAEPCNNCSSCLEIKAGMSMDLIEIDAASHRGIDEIRELRDGINFAPSRSKYRVFIIDEAHQLTKEAANALLKTLEEPPAHAVFILATTEVNKMIPTILSRCQRFDFLKLTVPEIIERLELICKMEKAEVEKRALELIAANAGGSIRDAESLLDQALAFAKGLSRQLNAEDIKDILGLVDNKMIIDFAEILVQKNLKDAVNFLNEAIQKGADLTEFNKSLINYFRKILVLKIAPTLFEDSSFLGEFTPDEIKKLKKQINLFSEKDVKKILNLLLDANNKMKFSPIQQLPLELAIFEFCFGV